MSDLTIEKRDVNGIVILDMAGKIRLGEGNLNLHRTLRSLVEGGQKYVVLNLSQVTSIDSSGLGELVAGYTTLEKGGGVLKLLGLTERVNELMVITKLLTVFDVFDDEASALKSFDRPASELTTQPLDEKEGDSEAAAKA